MSVEVNQLILHCQENGPLFSIACVWSVLWQNQQIGCYFNEYQF